MNLGQAVAVCLYEMVRNPQAAKRKPQPAKKAVARDLDLITDRLLEILALSGYVNERTAASTAVKVRRLVRRMDINSQDAEVWLGILRQLLWKLDA